MAFSKIQEMVATRAGKHLLPFPNKCEEAPMGLLLLIVLLVLLLGGMPRWGYSRDWGYGPSGALGVLLLVLLVLMLFSYVPFTGWGWGPHGW